MDGDVRSPRRSWRLIGAVCVLLLAAIAAAAFALAGMRVQRAKALPAHQSTAAVSVSTVTVEPQSAELTRRGLGTVLAWNTDTVTPEVSGQIVELPFREGAVMHAGDVLVRIDPRPFQAVLDQAKAKKAQDEANLVAAQKNLWRDETLLNKGGFATQQTVDNERAQVEAYKAMILGDQAAIQSAQLSLEFATVKAPFTGVVGLRNVDVGNLVTPASNILTITQIEPIAVDFTLPQADLALLQAVAAEGEPKVIAFDQDGNNMLGQGTLEAINNQVDPTTGTIKLKARFDNKDHKLWPGAFVQARVVVKAQPDAIVVPSQAVERGPDGPYVWLVTSDQAVRIQPVGLGDIQDDRTVVAKGLAAGDRIVIDGQYSLTPGARVAQAAPQGTHGSGP